MANGTGRCWGNNENGQLGDGSTLTSLSPRVVSGLSGVAALDAGDYHICARTVEGAMYCWGRNGNGSLGDGSVTRRLTPTPVVGLSTGVTDIAAGSVFTCAVVHGGVRCWGYNFYGQLGDGTTVSRSTPAPVVGLSTGVVQIVAGSSHACALLENGGVRCWGRNDYACLGDGSITQRNEPVVPIGLSSGVRQLAAGALHTCALLTTGAIRCWGHNMAGALGDGTTIDRLSPTAVANSTPVVQILAGAHHTCAILPAGTMECWGYNSDGQLGTTTTNNRLLPTRVRLLDDGILRGDASRSNTCAVRATGGLWCWGSNGSGQVGDGTWTHRTVPTYVRALAPTNGC